MTNEGVLAELKSDSALNRARMVLSGAMGRIEQQSAQGLMRPIDMRKAEFEAVKKIAEIMNETNDGESD